MNKDALNILERDINQLIILDSNDRDNNRDPGNFYFKKNFLYNGAQRLGIRDYNIIFDIPNINVFNNKFKLNDIDIELPIGYYDTENLLASSLETAINSKNILNVSVSVVYDVYKKCFTIINAGSALLSLICPTEFTRTTGFYTNTTPMKIVSGYRPTMMYTTYLDICSNRLTTFTRQDDTSNDQFNLIERIYINRDNYLDPQNFYYEFKNIKWLRFIPSANLNYVDIQIRDEYNRILELDKNMGYQFRLQLSLLVRQEVVE